MQTDYLLSNIIFYAFDIAVTTMMAESSLDRLYLSAPLTKEQTKALKKDLAMTDTAIQALRRCKSNWQAIQRDVDVLSPFIYNKVGEGLYDWSHAMTNELVALLALYLQQSNNDNDSTIGILKHIIDIKPLDKETAQFAQAWLAKAGDIRRAIFAKEVNDEQG